MRERRDGKLWGMGMGNGHTIETIDAIRIELEGYESSGFDDDGNVAVEGALAAEKSAFIDICALR